MVDDPAPECLICDKLRGVGPLVTPAIRRDELVSVSHRQVDPDGTAPLGHLVVESIRHVPYLDDLTEAETTAMADAVRRSARALRAELEPAFVFTMVIGMGIAHVHQHVLVRHPRTPHDVPWHASLDWSDAPRGDAADIAVLSTRLAARFAAASLP